MFVVEGGGDKNQNNIFNRTEDKLLAISIALITCIHYMHKKLFILTHIDAQLEWSLVELLKHQPNQNKTKQESC